MIDAGADGTVDDAAGVSSSQIYHYFADKNALTRAVIAHQTDAIVGSQTALLSRLDSLGALRAWRDVVVNSQRDLGYRGGCPLGSLSSELSDHSIPARTALAESFTQWAHAIRDGLRHMIDNGVLLSGTDPDRLSLALLAALQGGLLLAQAQHNTAALEAGLDTIIDQIQQHTIPQNPTGVR